MSIIKDENYIHIEGWMINKLNLKGNDLLVYAIIYGFSQDGESRYTGSLQYLADWCNSTKQGIQKNLSNLVEKGYIQKFEMVKNRIKYCEYSCIPCNSVVYPMQLSCNNTIDSTKEENNNLSKDKLFDTMLGYSVKEPKSKRGNLFTKCDDEIAAFTNNVVLLGELREYLSLRLKMTDKPIYGVNQWKGILNKLDELSSGDNSLACKIVKQSIERGYASFFPLNAGRKTMNNTACEDNVYSDRMTEEDYEKQEDFIDNLKKRGKRIEF